MSVVLHCCARVETRVVNRNFIFERGRSVTSVMGGGVGGEGSKPRHIIRMCGGRGVNPGTLLGLSNVDCTG